MDRKGIAEEVIDKVEEKGGRFLCKKLPTTEFLDFLEKDEKFKKVMQSLRDEAKRNRMVLAVTCQSNKIKGRRILNCNIKVQRLCLLSAPVSKVLASDSKGRLITLNARVIQQNPPRLQIRVTNQHIRSPGQVHVIPDDRPASSENGTERELGAIQTLSHDLRNSVRY
mmetsp:Transcript_24225/g.37375  ORF Transcript_24225/g.37375 Transcript_24225/m.37375 type:complete len:168 (-) Transcript_24225:193-696(-)